MPTRVDRSNTTATTRPTATTGPAAPPAPAPQAPASPGRRVSDAYDTTKPRADGSLFVGHRQGGPGEVSLSKTGELLLNGKAGGAATLEAARLIETGVSPFAHASEKQRAALVKTMSEALDASAGGRDSTRSVLNRSAAATVLLDVARNASPKTRDAALQSYLGAMDTEKNPLLRKSMLVNFDATHLEAPKGSAAKALDEVRAQLLPPRPPYDEWFKGNDQTLDVRHYVMDEFWKQEVAAWKGRGLKVVSEHAGEIHMTGELKDDTGKNPPTKVDLIVRKEDTKVLRDVNDPKVDMIVYSGHSQLGGVLDEAVASAPKKMAGTKLLQFYNCRGKQNQGEVAARFPNAHVTSTWSSAYGHDDVQMLTATLQTIAARDDYAGVKRRTDGSNIWQGEKNYMLPDDPRNLGTRDDDRDGLRDSSALGPDRLFDPGRLKEKGGANVFRPSALHTDVQDLSGAKLEHAVGYANTTFFYFAEANHAAPLRLKQTDRFLPGGWFTSNGNEPVRITETKKGNDTWYTVSVNSKYADKSREVITSYVIMELQKHLAGKDGDLSEKDMMQGLMLVGGYYDLFVEYSDVMQDLFDGFSKTYGFDKVTVESMYKAFKKDGHDGVATSAALESLKKSGITVTLPRSPNVS